MFVNVIEVEHYTDSLFRIRTERPDTFKFKAGEFVMIGMGDNDIMRAYSITSGPEDDHIEFYSIKVQDGPLTGRLQHVKVGDELEVAERTTGTITLDNIEPGGNLWLLATGTGIAPFISILRDNRTYDEFDTVNVIWSVRSEKDLAAYRDFISKTATTFVPIVTRDHNWSGKTIRMSDLISLGHLMTGATPEYDKVMLCGSMEFNNDMKELFLQKNWVEGSRKIKGTFVQEKAFVS